MRNLALLIPLTFLALSTTTPAVGQAADGAFARDNLVAWCVVPFDARQRGPAARATMLRGLGLQRVAYDWREQHVPTFEQEILEYKKAGLEYFAFWGWHADMAALIPKHGIRPQIWQTCPSPAAATQAGRVEAAARQLMPLVAKTRELGLELGLYNHGGWGGEPTNLIAVCKWLEDNAKAEHVGIVYNFHHGHDHIEDFAAVFGLMMPRILCLNINGMNDGAKPKILPIGQGQHEARMISIVRDLGYRGAVGILDHVATEDTEVQLRKNLAGLRSVLDQIDRAKRSGAVTASDPRIDTPAARAAETPFPGNRVRNFYAQQARRYLGPRAPLPRVLPAFPGLDGGSFGHWGQNPESDNFDQTLNDVRFGGLLAQVVHRDGQATGKAVSLLVGEAGERTVMFDAERLTFTDAWRGGLVIWSAGRYGITSGVKPAGPRELESKGESWSLPAGTPTRYLGLHRNGGKVVFVYAIGDAVVYDHAWFAGEAITRSLSIEGTLPAGAELRSSLAPSFDGRAKALAIAGASRWSRQTVETVGRLGAGAGPYVIDTLSIPIGKRNPFGSPMRIGGFDFLPDGRIAVGTLVGDVWLVDGVDDDLDRLTWKRIAAGLHQCLGLVVQDGKILVLGRDQITRLIDLNGDDETDFYECVTNDYPTEGGNNFACTLHQDDAGTLYWFTRSRRFGMTRYAKGGKPESIATGLRGTNGTGVSPDGKITLATAQEGSWTPATAIFEVGGGSYHGFFGPQKGRGENGYDLPICFVPRGVDNSAGDIAFLPEDPRFGPLAGRILGTSFGYCEHYIVLRESVGGRVQGGIVPLPGEFLSGAHRSRFHARDGHFYVAGTDGWQSYARDNGSLQRVRYVGGAMHLPDSVETRRNGLIIRFNTRVDPASVVLPHVFVEQWNYLYSQAYGSQEYSVRHPGINGHDRVDVRSVHTMEAGRAVFLHIPQLHPVMAMHVYLKFATAGGEPLPVDLYYSIYAMGEPFKAFPGYTDIAKQPAPKFPVVESFPLDPRLAKQEALGKYLGGGVALTLRAVAGLKFAPAELRVPAGRRVALTFENADPSMPHNFALVLADRLQSIGKASMQMAADPLAVARHYVPEDRGVICMSPILDPGGRYTIYFDSPKQPGDYPFLCTFPGHWMVMRGLLKVK